MHQVGGANKKKWHAAAKTTATREGGKSRVLAGSAFPQRFFPLEVRRADGNLAKEAVWIRYANRLGTGLRNCWREFFVLLPKRVFAY